MLIGLDADSRYEENRAVLELEDIVIYYTDGLIDAAAESGDRFDEENLIIAFSNACRHCNGPQEIIDYLFDQVQKFIGADGKNIDDMTLIAMQLKS